MVQNQYRVQVIGSRPEAYTFPDGTNVIGTRYFSEFQDEAINGVGVLDFFVNKQAFFHEELLKQKIPFYCVVYKQGKKWQFLQLSDNPK